MQQYQRNLSVYEHSYGRSQSALSLQSSPGLVQLALFSYQGLADWPIVLLNYFSYSTVKIHMELLIDPFFHVLLFAQKIMNN